MSERGGERRKPETPLLRRGRRRRYGVRWLRLCRDPHLQRISANLPVDVLELSRAEIGYLHLEPAAHLPIGVLRKTNCARLRNALQPRRDVHSVAHHVAVALLDHVAEMDADPKFDALVGRDLGVALDHRPLDFDGAIHCDHAAEFNDTAAAGALDDAAAMHRDGRVDQVAAKGPKASEDSIFIRTRKPRVADHVGHQDRREFPGLAHGASAEA